MLKNNVVPKDIPVSFKMAELNMKIFFIGFIEENITSTALESVLITFFKYYFPKIFPLLKSNFVSKVIPISFEMTKKTQSNGLENTKKQTNRQ